MVVKPTLNHLETVDTLVTQNNCLHKKTNFGYEQSKAVDSIKHCEKRLPLK